MGHLCAKRTGFVRYSLFHYFSYPFSQSIRCCVSIDRRTERYAWKRSRDAKRETRLLRVFLFSFIISSILVNFAVLSCLSSVCLRLTPIYIEKYQHDSETFIQTYNINCLTCDFFFFRNIHINWWEKKRSFGSQLHARERFFDFLFFFHVTDT